MLLRKGKNSYLGNYCKNFYLFLEGFDINMKKTIRDIDVSGKRVLVRCDFNVPQDENGKITDTRRIKGAIPTIKYLLEHNAKVILCSHLGRPKGEVNKKYSLEPVAEELEKELGINVKLAEDIIRRECKRTYKKYEGTRCCIT